MYMSSDPLLSDRKTDRSDHLGLIDVQPSSEPQGPWERMTTYSEMQTVLVGVNPCPSARESSTDIGDDGIGPFVGNGHHTQQNRLMIPLLTPYAGSDRLCARHCLPEGGSFGITNRGQCTPRGEVVLSVDACQGRCSTSVVRTASRSTVRTGSAEMSVSGRMSIRQPVNFAANRAF
jgi:hypothetical protein